MISLKQLTYALTVEETLHFRQAAERCAISQSALSTAISELESHLKVQIFERDNKKVLVTALGKEVLNRARRIKNEADALYLFAKTQKDALSTPLTLGVIPTIGPYLLPRVLPSVRSEYPDFKLTIIEAQSQVLLDKVRRGDIDTAILALPFDLQGLLAFKFWQENFLVVANKEDAIAQNKQIENHQLQSAQLLLLEEGHCLKDHALAACKLAPHSINHNLAGTSLYTLVQMVAGKMGVTLVPELGAMQLIGGNKELKAIPLAESGPHRSFAFITRPNYSGVHNIEVLIKLFVSALSK